MRDLARQLTAHPRWEWRVGMVTGDGVIARRMHDGSEVITGGSLDTWRDPAALALDIHHPATRGVLLAMLREAHGDWVACYRIPHTQWAVVDCEMGETLASGIDEGTALAAALLRVWGVHE